MVVGQLFKDPVNGNLYTVIAVDGDRVTVNVNSNDNHMWTFSVDEALAMTPAGMLWSDRLGYVSIPND